MRNVFILCFGTQPICYAFYRLLKTFVNLISIYNICICNIQYKEKEQNILKFRRLNLIVLENYNTEFKSREKKITNNVLF